jgi:hypothetical protein
MEKREACPPEELMAPEKREITEEPSVERRTFAPETGGPLPADIIERYAAEGLDLTGLTARDTAALRSFEAQPLKDNAERVQLLKELIPALRQLGQARHGEKQTAPGGDDHLERMAGPETRSEGGKIIEFLKPARKTAIAAESTPFDAEGGLQELIRQRAEIEDKVAALPEQDRAKAREKMHLEFGENLEHYKQEALEQRRAMTELIDSMREVVLSGIETESGLTMDKMIALADRAADPEDGPGAVKAASDIRSLRRPLKWRQMLRKEWWTRGIPVEEVMTPKKAELDDEAVMEAVERCGAKARLTPEQKESVDRMAETIIDRRKAIQDARQQAPTPESLYRLCFGREPIGKVTVIEGPITLYFRCQDADDYALIHSQKFAFGELSVTNEERADAMKSGGVSISASRAESPNMDKDADLLDEVGRVDETRLAERRRLLTRLGGAIIAENNTIPRSFMHRWGIYRHEEQHAIKKIMGEFELQKTGRTAAKDVLDLMEISKEESAKAEEILDLVRSADAARDKGRDPESEIKKLHDRLAELEKTGKAATKQMQEWLTRFTEDTIEARAKDEILAYYLDGRLADAVEVYEMRLTNPGPVDHTQPVDIDLVRPYLKESKTDGGLYDYHADPRTAQNILYEVMSEAENIVAESSRAEDIEAALGKFPAVEEKTEGQAEAEIESREALANDMKGVVEKALTDHRQRYDKVLDQAYGAIGTLEQAGFGKQEIIDTLAIEPLRRWPRLAARLAKQERQASSGRRGRLDIKNKIA